MTVDGVAVVLGGREEDRREEGEAGEEGYGKENGGVGAVGGGVLRREGLDEVFLFYNLFRCQKILRAISLGWQNRGSEQACLPRRPSSHQKGTM